MALKPVGIPKPRLSVGEDRLLYDWVLTPYGDSTPNSIHLWDMGLGETKEEELYWNDEWYYTENIRS